MYEYFECDEEQKRIIDYANYAYLSKEEQVNYHFMMHMRSKFQAPEFMSDYEEELLGSKYECVRSAAGDLESIDLNKTYIRFKTFSADELDKETFQKLFDDKLHPPIVIKGGLADTEAVRKWSHEYFLENHDDVKVIAFDYDEKKSGALYGFNYKKMMLADVVKSQLDRRLKQSFYLNASTEVFKDYPFLLGEIGAEKMRELFDGHSMNSFTQLFIGNDKTWGTNWHQGNDTSSAMMINGVKRWYFLDPRLTYSLKMFFNGSSVLGKIDARHDLEFQRIHNPLYAYIPKYWFDTEPGDVILFNRHWPHAVLNVTPLQILVTMRWTNNVDLARMKKKDKIDSVAPIYDNILDSDPGFLNFKYDLFKNIVKNTNDIGDTKMLNFFKKEWG